MIRYPDLQHKVAVVTGGSRGIAGATLDITGGRVIV